MSLISTRNTVTRFQIYTPLPADFREVVLDGFRSFAFTPKPHEATTEPNTGWVTLFDPSRTSFELNLCLYGSIVVATLRSDKKSVNSRYAQIELADRIHQAEEGLEGGTRLSKQEKKQFKEALTEDLLRRALPSVTLCPVAWDTETGEVFVFSASAAIVDAAKADFEGAFDVKLRPVRTSDWLHRVDALEAHHLFPDARGGKGHEEQADSDAWPINDPFEGAHPEIGSAFLKWLWWRSVQDEVVNQTPHIWLEGKLQLDREDGTTMSIDSALPAEEPAALSTLRDGRPTGLRLGIKAGDTTAYYKLALGAEDSITVVSVEVPDPPTPTSSEDEVAYVTESVFLMRWAFQVLRDLFREFWDSWSNFETFEREWLDT